MRAAGRIKAIPEARDLINIRLALAVYFIEYILKLSNIYQEGVITLLKSI
jgi:hypothetical protein